MIYYKTDRGVLYQGNVLSVLKEIADNSVDCCITSPPYFGLRDYQVEGQIGLEGTPQEYIDKLVQVFREVRRVLKDSGTLWVVIGDSYAASGGSGSGEYQKRHKQFGKTIAGGTAQTPRSAPPGLKPKDLVGIPWMLAFALRDDGWWLRSDVIWHKPSCMPESVTDRPTKAHEYIFLLSKSQKYFYDGEAIKEKGVQGPHTRNRGSNFKKNSGDDNFMRQHQGNPVITLDGKRNKRSVWTVATKPYKEIHFATFPPGLIKPCIKAGSSEHGVCANCGKPWEMVVEKGEILSRGGSTKGQRAKIGDESGLLRNDNKDEKVCRATVITGWQSTCKCKIDKRMPATVLDPFGGSGTTAIVAEKLNRNWVLIELNKEYCEMAKQRIIESKHGISARPKKPQLKGLLDWNTIDMEME